MEMTCLLASEFNENSRFYNSLSNMICKDKEDNLMDIISNNPGSYLCLLTVNDLVLSVIRFTVSKNCNYIDLENGLEPYLGFLLSWLISGRGKSWSVFIPNNREDMRKLYNNLEFKVSSTNNLNTIMTYN
jgi:hypothetical protein